VFVGKLTVFSATAEGGLFWLVVVGAVNTVASLYYYLRWIAAAYATPDGDTSPRVATVPLLATYACAAGSLVLGAGVAAAFSLA
jgi:NADH-quinone oxidoreductase subunit N